MQTLTTALETAVCKLARVKVGKGRLVHKLPVLVAALRPEMQVSCVLVGPSTCYVDARSLTR